MVLASGISCVLEKRIKVVLLLFKLCFVFCHVFSTLQWLYSCPWVFCFKKKREISYSSDFFFFFFGSASRIYPSIWKALYLNFRRRPIYLVDIRVHGFTYESSCVRFERLHSRQDTGQLYLKSPSPLPLPLSSSEFHSTI